MHVWRTLLELICVCGSLSKMETIAGRYTKPYFCEQFIAITQQHVISVLTSVWMLCRKTLYCTQMSVLWSR